MFELFVLKKYKSIFSDILFGFDFERIDDSKMIFKDYFGNQMNVILNNNVINFCYQNLNYERQINLELPNKDEYEDIKVIEFVREIRPNGTIIEKNERIYGFSNYSYDERTLVDLVSNRYVFDKNMKIKDIDKYDQSLNNLSVMKTTFECHMHVLLKPNNSVRWYKDSPYSTHTLLNGIDISHIYDVVNGINKISRINDLYNGVINERNKDDIFSIHLGLLRKECLGYKEISGIIEKENFICGKAAKKLYINQNPEFIQQFIQNRIGYKKSFSCDDLNSLIEAITYQKTSIVEAGLTPEKEKQRLEEKIDEIYDSKSIAFIKKLPKKLKIQKFDL